MYKIFVFKIQTFEIAVTNFKIVKDVNPAIQSKLQNSASCHQQCYVLTNNKTSASNHGLLFSTNGICSIDNSSTIDNKCKAKEMGQSSIEINAIKYLQNTKWKLFLTISSNERSLNGVAACHLSDNVSEVLSVLAEHHCHHETQIKPPTTAWEVFTILGLACTVVNVMGIYTKLSKFVGKKILPDEIKIYYFLVLNLAISDSLMGVHLLAVAFEMKRKSTINSYVSEPFPCDVYGVLNLLSSQVTVTIILIISYYRLYGVIWPYKQPTFRFTIILSAWVWLLCLVVLIFPVLDIGIVSEFFTWGITKDYSFNADSQVMLKHALDFTATFVNFPDNDTDTAEYVNVPISSSEVLLKSLVELQLTKTNEKWMIIKMFQKSYFCAINFILSNAHKSAYFALGIVLYNFLCCILIIIAYIRILAALTSCTCIVSAHNTENVNADMETSRPQNDDVFFRISIVIATNLLCWIPLCLCMFILRPNVRKPNRNCDNFEKLVNKYKSLNLATFCMVSFNSIINPYVYSMNYWKQMRKKLLDFVKSKSF